jgi:hypothetical protein
MNESATAAPAGRYARMRPVIPDVSPRRSDPGTRLDGDQVDAPATAPPRGAHADADYGSLHDLLDRVERDTHAAGPGRDPTALPAATDCRRSLSAIAAAGFSDVHLRPVPYLNQGARPWAAHPYPRRPAVPGESRTIQQAGCAPTALAMIDCGLRAAHTSPIATADFAVRHRHSGSSNGAGTDTGRLARDWAAAKGLDLTAATSARPSKNVDVLKAGLQANGIALVSVGVDPATGLGHFTAGSHVIVINGCARRGGQDWFAIANPGRARQADHHAGLLATDAQVTQIDGAVNGVGQVWISRQQLEAEMKRCFVFRPGVQS